MEEEEVLSYRIGTLDVTFDTLVTSPSNRERERVYPSKPSQNELQCNYEVVIHNKLID